MNNRFDEMVQEAVNDVETKSRPEPDTSKRQCEPQKVVSIASKGDSTAPKQKTRSKSKTEFGVSTATLARGMTRALVTKTVRFRPEVAEALNQIVLENKFSGSKPDTIQEIVNEAAENWLKNHKPGR